MKSYLLILVIALVSVKSFSQSLNFEKSAEGLWVKENGEKVLFYQAKTKSLDGTYSRANYVHPLYNVDGFELTEDFPKDHLHHRGIFWTWHQTIIGDKQIGDAWECKDFVWDVIEYDAAKSEGNTLIVNTKTFWKSPLWKDAADNLKPFVEENAKIIVHQKKENYRLIDFEISLLALEKNLKIGGSDDVKGYGGFSPRIKLPSDLKFISEGKEVVPQTEQLKAGSWMNMSGTLAEKGQGGVIMMCHPDNPGYPEKWILRKRGSMQNPAYPGREPVKVSSTKPTVLKYRLVVYTGNLSDSTIEEIDSEFR